MFGAPHAELHLRPQLVRPHASARPISAQPLAHFVGPSGVPLQVTLGASTCVRALPLRHTTHTLRAR
eukprot:6689814-Pyramimonas_sp.AAC.1